MPEEITFLEGVDFSAHIELLGSQNGDHHPGNSMCLTGDLRDLGPSIDHFIADRLGAGTPYPVLNFGVRASGYAEDIFHRADGEQAAKMNDPHSAFDVLFGDLGLDSEALARLTAQRKSVLGLAKSRLDSLRTRVGAADRAKMDAHLEAIAQVEAQLAAPQCSEPVLVDGDGYREEGQMQIDLALAALRCDLTRVVSLQWSTGASEQAFPDIGIPYGHHTLAHLDVPGLDDPQIMELLFDVGAWYAQRIRDLVDGLRAWPEGNGTMFDNTVILWCSEHAAHQGGHDRDNMPYVLIGRAGGYFAGNRFAAYDHASNNDLFISLAHAMGLEDVTSFGASELCNGPLSGLT